MLLAELARTKPGATIVMDNLSVHKSAQVRARIEAAGCRLGFLPRYAPDPNPIEPCWSKLKTLRRAKEARSVEALDGALPAILATISAQDAQAWFRHGGYATPS